MPESAALRRHPNGVLPLLPLYGVVILAKTVNAQRSTGSAFPSLSFSAQEQV